MKEGAPEACSFDHVANRWPAISEWRMREGEKCSLDGNYNPHDMYEEKLLISHIDFWD